jgi:predicted transcriptional regulator
MTYTHVYPWIKKEKHRIELLIAVMQPMTARQISRKTGIPKDTCSHIVAQCSTRGLLTCLNPQQRNSRLYALTASGRTIRKHLCQDTNLPYKEYDLPDIDWSLYGSMCFRHRSAVVRTLSGPMQSSEIKRVLRIHQSSIKINANNIRDIIKLLLSWDVVKSVKVGRKVHLYYELTELGIQLQRLLRQAQGVY